MLSQKRYVIRDRETGNFVDGSSIFIWTYDGKTEWVYSSYISIINAVLIYPTKEHATKVMYGLRLLAQMAGINAAFEVTEYKREGLIETKGKHVYIPVPKGKITECRKIYKSIAKEYIR